MTRPVCWASPVKAGFQVLEACSITAAIACKSRKRTCCIYPHVTCAHSNKSTLMLTWGDACTRNVSVPVQRMRRRSVRYMKLLQKLFTDIETRSRLVEAIGNQKVREQYTLVDETIGCCGRCRKQCPGSPLPLSQTGCPSRACVDVVHCCCLSSLISSFQSLLHAPSCRILSCCCVYYSGESEGLGGG